MRANLVQAPTTYTWSSCAAYAHGTPNPLVTFHPSYLGLSCDPAGRQPACTALLAPSPDLRADVCDLRWTAKRAIGSLAYLARYGVGRCRPMGATRLAQNQ